MNISPIEALFISTVDFSLITKHVIQMKTTKIIAIISANLLYPILLISLSVAPPNLLPRAATLITVTIEIRAEPTPAHDLAKAERLSLSLPLSVNAGTIDQYGISIMV